jgi:hypothetical protein
MQVSIGRETEEVHVDVDLSKEGKANKISRRQVLACHFYELKGEDNLALMEALMQ